MQTTAAQTALAPHRQCAGCGYDIGSLPLTAMCPECNRSVAETCSRPLLRDDPRRCVRLASWLHWLWWSSLASGTCITLFILSATLFAGLGLGRWAAWLGAAATFVSLLTATVSLTGVLGTVARESAVARRAMIATLVTAFIILVALAVLMIAELDGWIGRSFSEAALRLVLAPLTLSSFATLAWGSHALAWIAGRTDRFVARPQTNRFAFLSTLWHALVLVITLPLSLLILFASNGSDFERVLMPLAGAWFISWIGHAGWAIYAMVAIARVRGAVLAESRACRGVAHGLVATQRHT